MDKLKLNDLLAVYSNLQSFQLLTSAICNTNCDFCCLHYKNHNAYVQLNRQVAEAWKTGEYIRTVEKVLSRLNLNNSAIKTLVFGSVEASIQLDLVAEKIDDILSTFPELKRFHFGTNLLYNVNNFCHFFEKLNSSCVKMDRRVSIFLLISIDGPDALSQKGHKGKLQEYKNNIKYLIDFINEHQFDNFNHIYLYIHPTIDKNTFLTYFSDRNSIYEYMDYLNDFGSYVYNLIHTKGLEYSLDFPELATPFDFTTEEAQKLRDIFDYWDRIKFEYLSTHKVDGYDSFLNIGSRDVNYLISTAIGYAPACANTTTLATLLLPDGSMVDCIDNIIKSQETYEDTIKSTDANEYYTTKMYRKWLPNPLTDSDDELKNKMWNFVLGMHSSNKLRLNLMSGLMDELALSGQIPFEYFSNPAKKLSGMEFVVAHGRGCPRNSVHMTKIFQSPYTGLIRKCLVAEHPYRELNNTYHSNPVAEYYKDIKDIF